MTVLPPITVEQAKREANRLQRLLDELTCEVDGHGGWECAPDELQENWRVVRRELDWASRRLDAVRSQQPDRRMGSWPGTAALSVVDEEIRADLEWWGWAA